MSPDRQLDLHHRHPAGPSVTVLAFSPITRRGSLVGFADLHLPRHRMKLFSCTVHEQNGSRWVGLPARTWVDRDGNLVRDQDTGKPKYQPILQFDSKDILNAFSDAAISALDAYQSGWDREVDR
jgi:hypothetical protein